MKGPEQFKKTALGSVDLDIRGVVGTMQAEPRVFAHDAIPINVSDFGDLLMPAPTNSVGGEAGVSVFNRGCCLYVGVESNIEVQMESGRTCTFKRVPPGSFLPTRLSCFFSVLAITSSSGVYSLTFFSS